MNSTRFHRYQDKLIHHLYVPTRAEIEKHGLAEIRGRTEAFNAVKDKIQPGDFILQSDMDEILDGSPAAAQTCYWNQKSISRLPFQCTRLFCMETSLSIIGTPLVYIFNPDDIGESFRRYGDDAWDFEDHSRGGCTARGASAGWHDQQDADVLARLRRHAQKYQRDISAGVVVQRSHFLPCGKRILDHKEDLYHVELTPGNKHIGK